MLFTMYTHVFQYAPRNPICTTLSLKCTRENEKCTTLYFVMHQGFLILSKSVYQAIKYWRILAICLVIMLVASCISSAIKTSGDDTLIRKADINIRGGTLSGMLYVPKEAMTPGEDGSYVRRPAVVLSEGYLNSNQMQDPNVIELSRRGFVVFAIDMYGHGNSDLSPGSDDPSNSGSVLGAIDAFNYVKSLPYVDTTRIGMVGHSMGGMNIGNAASFLAGFYTEQDQLLNLLHDEFGVEVSAADVAAQDAASLAEKLSEFDRGRYEVMAEEIHHAFAQRPVGIVYMGSGPGFAGLGKAHQVEVAGNTVWRGLQTNVGVAIGTLEENAWLMFSSADDGINNAADLPRSTVAKVLLGTVDTPVTMREWYGLQLSDSGDQIKSTDLGSFDSLSWDNEALQTAVAQSGARVMYQPKEIHIMNHFSKRVTGFVVDFFTVVDRYNNGELTNGASAIASSSGRWQLKEYANGIALAAMFTLVVPVSMIVLRTPFFSAMKREVPEPRLGKKDKGFWIISVLLILISGLSLIPFFKLGGAPTTYAGDKGPIAWSAFFSQEMATRTAVWAMLNGLIALVLITINHYRTRADGVSFGDRYGLTAPARDIGKAFLAALAVFSLVYMTNVLSSFFFNGSDVRFWVIAGRVMTASQFKTWAGYIWLFLIFYLVNGMVVNSGRMKDMSDGKNLLVCALINGAGIFLLEAFLYLYELASGHMIWYNFGKDYFLYAVVVIPMIIVLPLAAVYSRKLYKETGSIYTGAFLNAMLFTWFVVGNTCYHFPNV